nr:hypothetical protein [Tanacetum cinerariifolium]
MHVANTTAETRCLALEAELANLCETKNQDNQTELINHFSKLEVSHLNLQLKCQNLKYQIGNSPPTPDKDTPDFDSVFVIGKMQASLQEKDNVIRQLEKKLSQLQVTRRDTDLARRVQTTESQITKLTDQVTHLQAQNDLFRAENDKVKQHYKQLNNRDAHLDYLRHLKESVETIRDIVEEAKVVKPLDRSIVSACRYTKHSQELLEYAIGTCHHDSQPRAKQLAHIPLIKKKHVIVAQPSNKLDSTTHPHVVTVTSQKTNVPVPPSTGVDCCAIASGSQPMSHLKPNRISPAKGDTKLQIDDQPRKNKSHLRTSTRTDYRSRLKRTVIDSHSYSVCQTCAKCFTLFNHDLCVATCLQSAMATPSSHYNRSVERKGKQVWKPKHVRQVWKPTGKVLTTIGHQWRPTGWIFDLDKMADVNAPSDQTSTMDPHVRADDQILPHIRWIPIGKNNCYLDLEKSQSNPIYKIAVDLLKNTNFFRAFTASFNLPSIYIQQFWDTILYEKKVGCYKCQLDEQWKHRFHPRPDSPLHMSNEEPVLGYLKFSAKGTKREIFGMPILSKLITANIQEPPYYQEYQENVAKHRGILAGETMSTQDFPAPKPAKPDRKPQSTAQKALLKHSISSLVTSTQPAPTSVLAKIQENKRKHATGTTDKPAKAKRIKRSASRKTHSLEVL